MSEEVSWTLDYISETPEPVTANRSSMREKFLDNPESGDEEEILPFTSILPHILLATSFITFLIISFTRYRMKRRSRLADQQHDILLRALSLKEQGQRLGHRLSSKRLRPRHISPQEGLGLQQLKHVPNASKLPLHLVDRGSDCNGPPVNTPASPRTTSFSSRSPPSTLDFRQVYNIDTTSLQTNAHTTTHPSAGDEAILPSVPVRLLNRQDSISDDVSEVISLPSDTPEDDVFHSNDSLEVIHAFPKPEPVKGFGENSQTDIDTTGISTTTTTIETLTSLHSTSF